MERLFVSNNSLSGCYLEDLSNLCNQLKNSSNNDISNGNSFNATWEDFCATNAGNCISPVYQGDFNNDGTANITDLLYWALAEGETGSTRPNASSEWTAQDCPDWLHEVNGVNAKHQDGDGNGVVESDDLLVLINNYGKTHQITSTSITGSPVQFKLVPVSSETSDNKTIIETYELYAENDLGIPFNTHGLSLIHI